MLQPLTSTEMKEFEKYVCDNFDITIGEMMQNAGRVVFDVVMNEIRPSCVLVVAGKGNNGGDAFVTAGFLYKAGAVVTVMTPYSDEEFTGAALAELQKLRKAKVPIINNTDEPDLRKRDSENSPSDTGFDLIIDGLFGFSLSGDPREPADKIINRMNFSGIPILSIDVPSGLDAETGRIMNPSVKASYTVTLGMPKIGLDKYKDNVGTLYLGDAGIPQKAYQELGVYTPIFLGKSYVTLD